MGVSDDSALRGTELVRATRERETQSPDGRLPLPELTSWDVFPYEGPIVLKRLDDVRYPEPQRDGADGIGCFACSRPPAVTIWDNARWRVTASAEPESVISLMLRPVDHLDLNDLNNPQASEFGRLIVRITRAIEGLSGVARAHVNKWGDGGEHLHVWFFGRPAGVLQLRGSSLPDWIDALPPMSQSAWDADLAHLRSALTAADTES